MTPAPSYQYASTTTSPVCAFTSMLTAARTPSTTAATAECRRALRVTRSPSEVARGRSVHPDGRGDQAHAAADGPIQSRARGERGRQCRHAEVSLVDTHARF